MSLLQQYCQTRSAQPFQMYFKMEDDTYTSVNFDSLLSALSIFKMVDNTYAEDKTYTSMTLG